MSPEVVTQDLAGKESITDRLTVTPGPIQPREHGKNRGAGTMECPKK